MKSIILKNVSKKVKIGSGKDLNPLMKLFYIISGKEPTTDLEILKDISLQVESGTAVGIVGNNGAGKSSLLRAIAGIYHHDKGEIEIKGKLISVISLSLHGRLTVKDNIYLCCTLYNIEDKEIKKIFDPIVKFAGVKKYIKTKVYQLSTGMQSRLVTSIAIHCNADILLVDDVDAVTDKSFTAQYIELGRELADKGATVLVVSHNMKILEKCEQVIWVDQGGIKQFGDSKSVIEEYTKGK